MADDSEFAAVVAGIRQDLATATGRLMAAAEAGLHDIGSARAGDDEALTRIEAGLLDVLQACAMEDLIGQRLTQLQALAQSRAPRDDALLNGPATPGHEPDQATIDAWFLDV